MDTVHFIDNQGKRFYIYALIDTFTGVGYAEYRPHLYQKISVCVTLNALRAFSYPISTIQTDNGGEFGESLYFFLSRKNIKLRHTRAGRPNDNAHIERFIGTIQEECFKGALPDKKNVKQKLLNYISYYNSKRFHLGINCNTPYEFVAKLLT